MVATKEIYGERHSPTDGPVPTMRVTCDIDLDIYGAMALLEDRAGLSNSQLICKILRRDPEMTRALERLDAMPDMPDYTGKKS